MRSLQFRTEKYNATIWNEYIDQGRAANTRAVWANEVWANEDVVNEDVVNEDAECAGEAYENTVLSK